MKINLVSYIDANYLPKFLICYQSYIVLTILYSI